MIKIITDLNGQELDLSADMEFELEIINPMFDADHIVVPFSTSIHLPPSKRNREILQYLPVEMMQPVVQSIRVNIFDGEIFLISGDLTFEAISEDGLLEYQFTGKKLNNSDTSLKQKIASYRGTKIYPLLVKKDHVGYSEYEDPNNPSDNEPDDGKYLNQGTVTDETHFPALSISTLLSAIGFQNVSSSIFRSAAVLAFDHDTKINEFLKDVCKLFCCIIYRENQGGINDHLELKDINGILTQTEYLDWSGKVSDIFSCTTEKGRGYKLAYANQRAQSKIIDLPRNAYGSWNYINDILEHVRRFHTSNQYKPARVLRQSEKRDYSMKSHTVNVTDPSTGNVIGTAYEVMCDFLGYYSNPEIDTTINDEKVDASVSFNLVDCTIVEKIVSVGSYSQGVYDPGNNYYMIVPRVEGNGNKGVLIGNLYTGSGNSRAQLTDDVIAGNATHGFVEFTYSLSIEAIFNRLHSRFSEWLSVNRQTVDVDINLTTLEIAEFKIWQKVMFANAFWLCKKLTVNITKDGINGCRGEFIEF